MLIIILCCLFAHSFAMDIPFEPIKRNPDWIGAFEPSPQAKKYEILVPIQKIKPHSDLPVEKQHAFEDCMDLPRADHLNINTLKNILDDVDLMEAVIAYAPNHTRNGFIELFFAASLLYEKIPAHDFFYKLNIYQTAIRIGGYNETPQQFIKRLIKEKNKVV